MPPLQLITFDMTGTLIAFRSPVMNQYASAAAIFGLKADPRQLEINFKQAWKVLSAQHPNFGQATGLGWKNWWQKIVLQTFDDTKNVKLLTQVSHHLIKHFETSDAWCVTDGGIPLLKNLRNQNYTLGVISNFDPRLHTIMKNLELTKYFSFVLTSYEIGCEKPDKLIFMEALRRAKVASPANAIHIGNDQKLDVEGAMASGFNAILLDTKAPTNLPHVISNIADVENCVKSYH